MLFRRIIVKKIIDIFILQLRGDTKKTRIEPLLYVIAHNVEITEIYFHYFFAKIPWNQRFLLNKMFSRNFQVKVNFAFFYTVVTLSGLEFCKDLGLSKICINSRKKVYLKNRKSFWFRFFFLSKKKTWNVSLVFFSVLLHTVHKAFFTKADVYYMFQLHSRSFYLVFFFKGSEHV